MTHGGKREGAGRPMGSRSAATKEQQATIAELAKEHTPQALSALVSVMNEGQSESARVSAANAVLDRAYGRPVQAIEHGGEINGTTTLDIGKLTLSERKALLAAVILDDDELSPDEG